MMDQLPRPFEAVWATHFRSILLERILDFDSSAFVAEKELVEALGKVSLPIICDEDRVLFTQGQMPAGLYLLRVGKATLTMESPTGGVVMSITALTGSVLGLPALIGNEPYTLTAVAFKGAELGFVSHEDFSSLMLSDPTLALRVLRVLAAEVRTARHAISEV
jgi:CRP-like cAMP-binding protein